MLHARDAEAATAGGADRLLLGVDPEEGYYSPDPAAVSAVVRETDLPVYVVLRTAATDHFGRLVDLGATFLELGAHGLAYGFLDRDLEIDRESLRRDVRRARGRALAVPRASTRRWTPTTPGATCAGCPAWSRWSSRPAPPAGSPTAPTS